MQNFVDSSQGQLSDKVLDMPVEVPRQAAGVSVYGGFWEIFLRFLREGEPGS